MNSKKGILSLIIIFSFAAISLLPHTVFAQESLNLPAESLILMDAESGCVLYEENADEPKAPASITKLMTLLLTFEALEEGKITLDETVIVSQEAWEMSGSQMYLNIGEEVSIEDLITGIAVVSANDACISIAEHLAGSMNYFVKKMNDKAAELGLDNTSFVDSHGLNDNNRMSARDIADLSRYLITNYPQMRQFDTIAKFEHNGIEQPNRNPLLGHYAGADGLKTGYTNAAGYNLAASAAQNDLRLIAVTLGSENTKNRLAASEGLLNYGFSNFSRAVLGTKNDTAAQVEVESGKERLVDAQLAQDFTAIIPFGEEGRVEKKINVNNSLEAPLSQGDKVGTITALLDGELVGEADLIAAEDVLKANFFTLALRTVGNLFAGFWHWIVNMIGF